jgi:hypothetical protein
MTCVLTVRAKAHHYWRVQHETSTMYVCVHLADATSLISCSAPYTAAHALLAASVELLCLVAEDQYL